MFELGDVVNVRGMVGSFQDRLQLRVEQIFPLRESDYSLDDLIVQPENQNDTVKKFEQILEGLQNSHCRNLVLSFWKDKDFHEKYISAAAGKKWHHAFKGGLIRHCYEMMVIGETMCTLFPEMNRDLLMTVIFLHDIGKIYEMSHGLTSEYTTEGKLLGHLHIGSVMVQQKMDAIADFPDKLRLEILHCILSHHGELMNGSPVTPRTLEAIVLHHIDNLDAQAAAFTRIIRETKEKGMAWSEYLPLIDRVIWAE